jgi:hypothetical protein
MNDARIRATVHEDLAARIKALQDAILAQDTDYVPLTLTVPGQPPYTIASRKDQVLLRIADDQAQNAMFYADALAAIAAEGEAP